MSGLREVVGVDGREYDTDELRFSLGDLVAGSTLRCLAPRHELNCQNCAQTELRSLFTSGLILPRANDYHKTMSQSPVLLANDSKPLI